MTFLYVLEFLGKRRKQRSLENIKTMFISIHGLFICPWSGWFFINKKSVPPDADHCGEH
jgi:hypothetical protein